IKSPPRSSPSAIVSLSLLSAVPWLPLPAHWKSPRKMIRISSHLVCTVNRLIGVEMSSIARFRGWALAARRGRWLGRHGPSAQAYGRRRSARAVKGGDHRRCPEGTAPLAGAERHPPALAPAADGC